MVWRETRGSWARLGFFFLCVGTRRGVDRRAAQRRPARADDAHARGAHRSSAPTSSCSRSGRGPSPSGRGSTELIASARRGAPRANSSTRRRWRRRWPGRATARSSWSSCGASRPGFRTTGRSISRAAPYSHDLLLDHGAVVQPELLSALGVASGDRIRLAGQEFTVRGVIARDRTQRRGGIAFGPRVYIDLAALRATPLLGFGSRAFYQRGAQTAIGRRDGAAHGRSCGRPCERNWSRSGRGRRSRIASARTSSTAENYLSLVGFAIVVLGGLGVWSVTRVIVQQKIRSVAILKCVGASSRHVLAIYVLAGPEPRGDGQPARPRARRRDPRAGSHVGARAARRVGRSGHGVGRRAGTRRGTAGLAAVRARAAARDSRGQAAAAAAGRHGRRRARPQLAELGRRRAHAVALALVAIWQAASLRAGLYRVARAARRSPPCSTAPVGSCCGSRGR